MVCKSLTLQVSPLQLIVMISSLEILLGSSTSGPGLYSIPAINRAVLISLRVRTLTIIEFTLEEQTNLSEVALEEHLGLKGLKRGALAPRVIKTVFK